MRNKDLNFNTDEEQESVGLIFSQALDILKEEDRELNFIESLLPLLKRGIGVHHSGLLPILKEVIELLFQEHLIKVGCCLWWCALCCAPMHVVAASAAAAEARALACITAAANDDGSD